LDAVAVEQPRDHTSEQTRSNFGRGALVEWPEVRGPHEQGALLAAFVQHRLCFTIREHLSSIESSVGALAQELHVNEETLRRKFRGEAWASAADLLEWCAALDLLGEYARTVSDLAQNRLPALPRDDASTRQRPSLARIDNLRRR
jgi:AraC-like DNA-binding protein